MQGNDVSEDTGFDKDRYLGVRLLISTMPQLSHLIQVLLLQVAAVGTVEYADGGPHGAHMELTEYGNLSSQVWVANPPPPAGYLEATVTFGKAGLALADFVLHFYGAPPQPLVPGASYSNAWTLQAH